MHYGRLPPSFLPLGAKRLYAIQAEIREGERVAMTVPDDYAIEAIDREEIQQLGVDLLPQPQHLSLTGALADALDRLKPDEPLQVLYGDTLVRMPEAVSSWGKDRSSPSPAKTARVKAACASCAR